ncbi:MAG: AgmX/PglI C-terminal domain-containing protein [Chitinispirillaceae bacterium]|nr:AgmX/PglI C-terminal domain-containing protein [Chitinispirillaceae bacterium]
MKYKVLIKKCDDAAKAVRIAGEIARWSGSALETVLTTLVTKPICVRQEADEQEARKIKAQFEAVGAEVVLVELPGPQKAAAAVPPVAAAAVGAAVAGEGEEEEEVEGRVLSDSEYAEVLKKRGDIFVIEKEKRLRYIEMVTMLLGVLFGFWISTVEVVKVATDFYQKMPEERIAKLMDSKELPQTLQQNKDQEKEKEEIKAEKTEVKKLKKTSKGAGGTTGGGGDPRARVTRQGVLGIISGQVKGKTVASADLFGKGGFASGIDAILSGVGGLKAGGGGGAGRKGAAGIGYGAGYGSGFGGSGAGGIDDLIGGLMGGGEGGGLELKKRGTLKISAPDFLKGGSLTGGRSKASIMRVVMQNLAALRYAYNKRLREKPGLKGKITVKFAIDEFGKVIFCQVIESTMSDPPLEQTVANKIKRWVFEKIDKPGDVTEVIYPFVFSQ